MKSEDQGQEENPLPKISGRSVSEPHETAPGETEPAPADPALALEAKTKEVEALQEQLLRLRADFDNFRKRGTREREEQRLSTAEQLIRVILPTLDNLERAVEAFSDSEPSAMREGLELILKGLREALEREGLAVIPALHHPFDPSRHEAVRVIETGDHPEGLVLEEAQRGYCLKDRVVRPARVVVAKNPQQEGRDIRLWLSLLGVPHTKSKGIRGSSFSGAG